MTISDLKIQRKRLIEELKNVQNDAKPLEEFMVPRRLSTMVFYGLKTSRDHTRCAFPGFLRHFYFAFETVVARTRKGGRRPWSLRLKMTVADHGR
jgi:hypothetical protein